MKPGEKTTPLPEQALEIHTHLFRAYYMYRFANLAPLGNIVFAYSTGYFGNPGVAQGVPEDFIDATSREVRSILGTEQKASGKMFEGQQYELAKRMAEKEMWEAQAAMELFDAPQGRALESLMTEIIKVERDAEGGRIQRN